MKFSYNWLQSLVSGKLPKPEKLAELLTMHSFEVKEVKKIGPDWLLDIDVLPNRAGDCFSHLGIAREIAAITNLNYREPFSLIKEDKKLKAKDFIRVDVRHRQACPRYTARVVVGVKIAPAPKDIQERLKVCGLRPINNIVDITNYAMLETGQPLHAFDGEKLEGNPIGVASRPYGARKIIVRFAKEGEKIITLDEEKYNLNENILVIADSKRPVAIAGIKGGKDTGIDKKTKLIVLESANFNPQVIRQGSQKLNLKTDASLRFEHGIDPNLTQVAINRAAYLIQKIACPVGSRRDSYGAGGKIAQGIVDFYPKKVLPKRIKLDLTYVEKLLGVKISVKEIKDILKRLDLRIYESGARSLIVGIPTRRLDLNLPEDLIEEIGRIAGYEKIPAIPPLIFLSPPERNELIFWEDFVKRILKELGFTEVYNYSFVNEKIREIFRYKAKELTEIENPINFEQKYLRPSLIPNLLINLQKNSKYFGEIRIFELGKVYQKNKILEKRMLSGAILRKGDKQASGIFFEVKGAIDSLLNQLGISNIWYDFYQPTPAASTEASLAPKGREESRASIWQIKKSAEIKIDQTEIGFLGELSPKILEEIEIKDSLVFFEIDFEKLAKFCSEEHEFRPLSRYPAAVRDLAILVPREVLVEEVLNKINNTGAKLVRDVDLFDIYEGEEIPEGKKNLAFHIIYQAQDHTLTSKEIDALHGKIMKTLEEEPEWQVRR